MAQEPTFIVPVDSPPPPQRRGRKPGNGKIQNTLRLARRVGEGGWMVIPDQCAQSYYRIRKADAEFRDVEIKIRKRPGVSGHDVYVKFPSGGAR